MEKNKEMVYNSYQMVIFIKDNSQKASYQEWVCIGGIMDHFIRVLLKMDHWMVKEFGYLSRMITMMVNINKIKSMV